MGCDDASKQAQLHSRLKHNLGCGKVQRFSWKVKGYLLSSSQAQLVTDRVLSRVCMRTCWSPGLLDLGEGPGQVRDVDGSERSPPRHRLHSGYICWQSANAVPRKSATQ